MGKRPVIGVTMQHLGVTITPRLNGEPEKTMTQRPVIGVTTQTLHSIDGIPAGLPQSVVMNQRYYVAITLIGAAPILIPLLDDEPEALRGAYDVCDGILIPGGVDVDPGYFGEEPHHKLGRIDPSRDRTEMQLARWAVEDRKPILGLCRGLQVINVAAGGTLWQDLASQDGAFQKHDYFPTAGFERDHLAHEVDVVTTTKLGKFLESPRVPVNSMHHQGIKVLGNGLVASAVAPDGLIEGVEGETDAFLIGVQWHPEVFEMADPHIRHLFGGFIRASVAWAQKHGTARTVVHATQG